MRVFGILPSGEIISIKEEEVTAASTWMMTSKMLTSSLKTSFPPRTKCPCQGTQLCISSVPPTANTAFKVVQLLTELLNQQAIQASHPFKFKNGSFSDSHLLQGTVNLSKITGSIHKLYIFPLSTINVFF